MRADSRLGRLVAALAEPADDQAPVPPRGIPGDGWPGRLIGALARTPMPRQAATAAVTPPASAAPGVAERVERTPDPIEDATGGEDSSTAQVIPLRPGIHPLAEPQTRATRTRKTWRTPVDVRRKFPPRTLWIVDIENLVGAPIPSSAQVEEVRDWYVRHLGLSADDQVVLAASHLGLPNAALAWPHARYRVRSGPDGADLELLDVLTYENVDERFTHVVIGSSDRIFDEAAASLAARGVEVTVVSRTGDRLSPGLARAAGDVIRIPASA